MIPCPTRRLIFPGFLRLTCNAEVSPRYPRMTTVENLNYKEVRNTNDFVLEKRRNETISSTSQKEAPLRSPSPDTSPGQPIDCWPRFPSYLRQLSPMSKSCLSHILSQ